MSCVIVGQKSIAAVAIVRRHSDIPLDKSFFPPLAQEPKSSLG